MDRYRVFTIAERPELRKALEEMNAEVWPRFMQHDNVAAKFWDRLFTDFADFQFVVCRENNVPVGAGNTIPLVWGGTIDDLPQNGWDGVILQGFENTEDGLAPNTLSALAAMVGLEYQGHGLSAFILEHMNAIARRYSLVNGMIAPVRPTMKSRYPLIPMEDYVQWRNTEGWPLDPWLRVHARLGADFLAIAENSMLVTGTVAEWEHWTNMFFPQSADYVVPGALVPVNINCEIDQGRYIEPNVWMHHPLNSNI